MLCTLAIENYRSVRSLVVPVRQLTVVTGPNGSGKSSLYRSLRMLAEAATGGLIGFLAREGGLPSTLWAGPETIARGIRTGALPTQGQQRKGPVRLQLGFAADDFSYSIDLGLPQATKTAFTLDPEIKVECIWAGEALRPSSVLAERRGGLVRVRRQDGDWDEVTTSLASFHSMLSETADPRSAPEVLHLRQMVRSWRFYDHFRTDRDAPARRAQVGTRTTALDHEGRDLAAALQTIRELGDPDALAAAVADAFDGGSVEIVGDGGWFTLRMHQPGLLRPLAAAELSDGTLRYLMWVAALLTPRPPALLVINEPETSLHHELIPALARLILQASRKTQVWVVSHSRQLVDALDPVEDCRVIEVEKSAGETTVLRQDLLEKPPWRWPPR